MKIVALVPIKLHSERLANKNILPLKGKPLSWHICNTLLTLNPKIDVYVYCSDLNVSKYVPEGVKVIIRDKYLDGNYVKGEEIYASFIKEIDADIYILAHTTSPFIKPESIKNALNKVEFDNYDSSFSAIKYKTFAWFNNTTINYELTNIPRTQDIEPVFIETSGFYIFRKEIFTKYKRRIGFKPYIQEISLVEAVDIDEEEDYNFAIKIANE